MSHRAAPEPTPEAITVSQQQEGKSQGLKAYTEWHYLSRLRVAKIARLGARMESAIWRHNSETAFYLYFCCLWIASLVFMCIFVAILLPRLYYNSDEHCAPDGSFRLQPFSILDPAWTFQVVIGFGSLDFTVVKTIDIVWDVVCNFTISNPETTVDDKDVADLKQVIGRAGQTLLAYITWKTFSKYLSSVITTDPITYQTFWTIFIQDGPSFMSILHTARDFTRLRRLRSPTTMFFIILAMIFVLIFPTLISSMAGYSASNQAMVKTDDISQVPFSQFQRVLYVVHDGDRINRGVDYIIVDQSWACGDPVCVFNYISMYGVSAFETSFWTGIGLLEPPTLNITSYWGEEMWGSSLSGVGPLKYKNRIYGPEYFTNDRAICQPLVEPNQHQQKYQWGFSIIQLEISLCLLTLWSFGICVMWATASLRFSSMGTAYNAPGKFKSAISLGDSMRKAFRRKIDEDINDLTESEVMLRIKMHLDGGKVTMESAAFMSEQTGWKLIKKWVKANKAWTVVIPALSLGTVALAAALIVKTA